MSAYIVDRGHVRFLVAAALNGRHWAGGYGQGGAMSYYHGNNPTNPSRYEVNELTADETGLMLWQECMASVSYRYPDDAEADLPGPVEDGPRFGYRHPVMDPPGREIKAVEVLSALACYEYQSCEHPGWEASRAKAFCDALRATAIRNLPGYDDAPWGAPAGWETAIPAGPRLVV